MIWLAILVPLGGAAALYLIYHHRIALWEVAVMMGSPILFIALAKGCSEYAQTRDTEFWGGYVTAAEYYEDWNERVSCRHPIYRTYTDKDGNSHSEYVGDEHPYDVDYHPEYWQVLTTLGEFPASRFMYDRLIAQFGNRSFVELHRSYHTNDGDKYVAYWKGEAEKLEPVTVEKTYENRIQASQSVFNFKEVNPADYGLYPYPKVSGLSQRVTHGPGATEAAERKIQYLNATLGSSKQVRLFILVFQNQPIQAAMEQEAFWKRGNKNELVTCVGVSKDLEVQWAHVFSWTEIDELRIEARNFVMGQKTLDLAAYADWLGPAVREKWVRKKFEDFSYLSVEPSMTATIWTFVGTVLITVGIGFWVVLNEAGPSGGVSFWDGTGNGEKRDFLGGKDIWKKRVLP